MRGAAGEVREVVRAATAEARRRRDGFVGTEHLLLGAVSDPVGIGSQALGVGVEELRAALERRDREALDGIGVDAALVLADAVPAGAHHGSRRLSLTGGGKRLLHAAVVQSRASGDRDIGVRHVLLALLATEPPDPACRLLQLAGVDIDAARTSLLPVTSVD